MGLPKGVMLSQRNLVLNVHQVIFPCNVPRAGAVGVKLPNTQTRIVDTASGENLGPYNKARSGSNASK